MSTLLAACEHPLSTLLSQMLWYLNTPWQAPLRIALTTLIVYQTLGVAVFAAMGLFCVLIPLQSFFAKRVAHHRCVLSRSLATGACRVIRSRQVRAAWLATIACWVARPLQVRAASFATGACRVAVTSRVVVFFRKQQLQSMDERINVISELVAAMRLVKMYCWERPFSEKVHSIRQQEMKSIW